MKGKMKVQGRLHILRGRYRSISFAYPRETWNVIVERGEVPRSGRHTGIGNIREIYMFYTVAVRPAIKENGREPMHPDAKTHTADRIADVSLGRPSIIFRYVEI